MRHMYEQNQTRDAYPNDKLKNLHDLTSPLKAEKQTIREMQITHQPNIQLIDDELSVTYWQLAGIGTLAGTIVTGLVLAFTIQMDLFDNLGRLVLAAGEVSFGIIGAWISKTSNTTWLVMWITAIGWALVPVLAALIFVLLLALMTLTSFFGV